MRFTGIPKIVRRRRVLRSWPGVLAAVVVSLVACGFVAGPAVAVSPSARLRVDLFAIPASFQAGGSVTYEVVVTNTGSEPTDGSAITIADTLPTGLTIDTTQLLWETPENREPLNFLCEEAPGQCLFPIALAPGDALEMFVTATVGQGAAGAQAYDVLPEQGAEHT